jgi:hypothetical protein
VSADIATLLLTDPVLTRYAAEEIWATERGER